MRKHTCMSAFVGLALMTSVANAQSFNVDVGTSAAGGAGFGAPSSAFGAAANQAGSWNNYIGAATSLTLNNLAGVATTVTLTRSSSAGNAFNTNNANTSGDSELLLDDGQDLSASTGFVTYTFANLAAGTYNLYTYAVAPDVAAAQDQTAVVVNGMQQIVTGPIPAGNNFALGVTYALHSNLVVAAGGSIVVTVDGINGGFGTLNGFQLANANNCLQPLPPCPEDCFPVPGDGVVNIDDLVQGVINHFGQVGPPRPQGDCFPLPNGDCLVNIDDLIQGVINHWGNCPLITGACCVQGNCQTLSAAQCAAAFGLYQGDGTSCPFACPTPPANDMCASRIVVTNGTTNWNNAAANTDGPAPPCGTPATRDVWFNYTATCTGHVTFDTLNTLAPFTDTVLAIYNGNSCSPLGASLGCNDDISSSNFLSSVTVDLSQGQVVKVRCMSFGTDPANSGAAKLNIACTPLNNDACSDAEMVTIGVPKTGNILGATQDQAPLCMGVAVGIGRWYKVVGNGNNLRVSTCESPLQSWEGRLSVYCGNSTTQCGLGATCVNASGTFDCGPGGVTQTGLHERLEFCSANGQTYLILVHTDALPLSPEGAFQLLVTDLGGPSCTNAIQCGPPPAPPNDECAGATGAFAGTCPVSFTVTSAQYVLYTTNSTDPDTTCEIVISGGPFTKDASWWYSITSAAAGTTMKVSMCAGTNTSLDVVCGLYSACGGTQVACDDDFCAFPAFSPSEFCANVAPNTTYKLIVDHYSAPQPGTYVVDVTCACVPPVQVCGNGALEPGEECDDGNLMSGDGCSSTCTFECLETCTLTEPETCGTNTNGGCNSTPTAFTNVTHNTTVCGTAWANSPTAGSRDTDWYQITVGASGTVQVRLQGTASAAYTVGTFILTPVCPPTLLAFASSVDNDCIWANATATPGSQVTIFIGAMTAAGAFPTAVYPCGTTAQYKATFRSP